MISYEENQIAVIINKPAQQLVLNSFAAAVEEKAIGLIYAKKTFWKLFLPNLAI